MRVVPTRKTKSRLKQMADAIPFNISALLVPLLILAGAGVVFGVMMLIAVVQWAKVAKARGWPVAAGTVLESGVSETTDSDGGAQYSAIIKYQYAVGGATYTNDLLAFGSRNLKEGGYRAEKKAHRTVAKYPVGSSVQIHYDPTRPESSVLEVRSAIANMLAFIGGLFLVVGVIVAAIVFFVNRP